MHYLNALLDNYIVLYKLLQFHYTNTKFWRFESIFSNRFSISILEIDSNCRFQL